MDLAAYVAIAIGLAFVAVLVWLATHHVDDEVGESIGIKPEHIAMMGVVTNDPTLIPVAYAMNDEPSVEEMLSIPAVADALVDPPEDLPGIKPPEQWPDPPESSTDSDPTEE